MLCRAPYVATRRADGELYCSTCLQKTGPQIEIVGALGDYGGGKSHIAAHRFLAVCLENPFEEGIHSGEAPPMSGICAPTMGDLKKGPLIEFFKVCPDELIYKARFFGEYQDITLINGHRALLYSAEGALNGPTLCQVWPDEIQEKIYANKWTNISKRVRDKRARRLGVTASGIAERGHVETIFKGKTGPTRHLELLFPEDNAANMAQGYVDDLNASIPASRERDADGWLLVKGAMYSKFSQTDHLRWPPGLEDCDLNDVRRHAVSFAVDFGRSAALLFGVPIHRAGASAPWKLGDLPAGVERWYRAGLFLIDQEMPSNMDAEEMVDVARRRCRENGWKIVKGQSVICLDPTAEPDQVREFQRAWPGVRIVQHQRGFYHLEENGIRACDRAMLDKNHDVRLFILPELANDPSGRGVVEANGSYLAAKPKDKRYEHAADVERYLTQHFVPLPDRPRPMDPDIEARLAKATRPLTADMRESNIA